MTPEQLAAICGILLSLSFSYLPGLSARWDALPPTAKRLWMAGLLLAVSTAVFVFACAGITEYSARITCDRQGLIQVVNLFISALIANQAAYQISPKSL